MNNKHRCLILSTGLLFLTAHTNVSAQETEKGGLGVSLKAGTLGAGLELDYPISPSWSIRLQANDFNFDDTFEEDDIEYDGELDLSSFGALVVWRPFKKNFNISAGIYSNSNELAGNAISAGEDVFEIGDIEYRGAAADPLRLDASVDLGDSTAGYFGIGWGSNHKSGFKFSFDIGVLFSGSPTVDLAVNGSAELVSNPGIIFNVNDGSALANELQQQISNEVDNLEDDISDFEFYPVVSLGIGYRF
ncbi:hypothetical protein EYS14_15810 [Alteromonadaceae bacterium M269]|nr:hypothetical protein EYS14_15810 [Alteromonadaceae bacterium M269]